MEDIITLKSYVDLHLAHLDRSELEAKGIAAFVTDEHTIAAHPFYNYAIGGVRLQVKQYDLNKALTIVGSNACCPQCESVQVGKVISKKRGWKLMLAALSALFAPSQTWSCSDCAHQWKN